MEAINAPIDLFIVHWNQPAECASTVSAFRAQDVPLRITIADNNSSPDARKNLRAHLDPAIEIVQLDENKGWGGALNVVLRQWLQDRESAFCFISAHDALPEKHCLPLLLAAANSDARIGIASPQYHDQTIARFSPWRGVFPERAHARPSGSAQPVDVPHGTLMLLRGACLQEAGLFDERFFAYGDEHELGLRAARRGWKVVMVWGAIVTNRGTWTPSALRSYLFTRNSLLLVHDYCGALYAWLRAALILLNTLRLMIFSGDKTFAFSPRARWRGVCDFFREKFGAPDMA